MMTQFKIKPGQVFYIKTLLSEGNKYYPLEISRVTAKCVFFTFDGINRRGELKTDKYGNQYFTKYCPECLVGVYHHTPMFNPDEPTEVETIEINSNVVSFADYRANVDTTEILETLENPQGSDSMNREDLIDRLAATKIKRYKAFKNNWNTSKFDSEITEITDLLKQLNDRDTETITPSDNLNTLESDTTEILETIENQGNLDKFEVTYQVAESEYEISYESRTVHATSKDHAKSIVSLDLQSQNLRFCITGVEEALVIDDLSDFSLEGHDEF